MSSMQIIIVCYTGDLGRFALKRINNFVLPIFTIITDFCDLKIITILDLELSANALTYHRCSRSIDRSDGIFHEFVPIDFIV